MHDLTKFFSVVKALFLMSKRNWLLVSGCDCIFLRPDSICFIFGQMASFSNPFALGVFCSQLSLWTWIRQTVVTISVSVITVHSVTDELTVFPLSC